MSDIEDMDIPPSPPVATNNPKLFISLMDADPVEEEELHLQKKAKNKAHHQKMLKAKALLQEILAENPEEPVKLVVYQCTENLQNLLQNKHQKLQSSHPNKATNINKQLAKIEANLTKKLDQIIES